MVLQRGVGLAFFKLTDSLKQQLKQVVDAVTHLFQALTMSSFDYLTRPFTLVILENLCCESDSVRSIERKDGKAAQTRDPGLNSG